MHVWQDWSDVDSQIQDLQVQEKEQHNYAYYTAKTHIMLYGMHHRILVLTAKTHNYYVIWDASSYFSVKMTEIYVISTWNFKWCILFEMFYVLCVHMMCNCVHVCNACTSHDTRCSGCAWYIIYIEVPACRPVRCGLGCVPVHDNYVYHSIAINIYTVYSSSSILIKVEGCSSIIPIIIHVYGLRTI